ncbi:MAG TPA: hypothetical protein VM432_10870 [Bdellovibrionales bacterium]|nr:hypothetical protein [Bdellovibrionales bacterium]
MRKLILIASLTIFSACSVYKSSDRDDFDTNGKERAKANAQAYHDLCSIIQFPKALLGEVDQLTVLPTVSSDGEISSCHYEAQGGDDSLKSLTCALSNNDGIIGESREVNEPTFMARAATESGFLKCSVEFDGLAASRNAKLYDHMSREFALFFVQLTSILSGHSEH